MEKQTCNSNLSPFFFLNKLNDPDLIMPYNNPKDKQSYLPLIILSYKMILDSSGCYLIYIHYNFSFREIHLIYKKNI